MFATLPVVQLYCRDYSAFYHAKEHLARVLEEHLLEILGEQDRRLLEAILTAEDHDFESRMLFMYGFCTTPLCKAAKRLMCAHLVRQVQDPLHLLAIWKTTPGRSHPFNGPFPRHALFEADLKRARSVFRDLVLPTVDLAQFVRLELRFKRRLAVRARWGEAMASVKEALKQACKGSREHMITLSKFVGQEVRREAKIARFQKLLPPMPLDVQAEEGMRSESGHEDHADSFRQLQHLLSRIHRSILQSRIRCICNALVDHAQMQACGNIVRKRQRVQTPLELHWTIRHLMMARCNGLFSPIEIEVAS